MTLSAKELGYEKLNEAVRHAAGEIQINDCFGERFIGCGAADKTITINGTPGNAMGAYLNGATMIVKGNAQDAVGDTMNAGRIVIHGNAGDALGYAMRGGEIYVKGEKVHIRTPKDAIKRKIAFLTEDRKGQGLVLNLDVRTNLVLANMKGFSNGPFLDKDRIEQAGNDNVSALKIKTPSLNEVVGQLSGGNQQKVVIGKWVNTDADIFIFDEPTRGIDVGAKIEVYRVMNDLVKAGKCVIMVSSELPEILAMSDHVVVMRGGRVMADIDRDTPHFNSEDIMKAAWGGELD
mgnify:CR=1 FL=1